MSFEIEIPRSLFDNEINRLMREASEPEYFGLENTVLKVEILFREKYGKPLPKSWFFKDARLVFTFEDEQEYLMFLLKIA